LHVAQRFEIFLDAYRRPDGIPWTDQKLDVATGGVVARMSAGALTVEVEGIRTGDTADPTVGQVAALAAVFGVPASYLVERGKGQPVLDEETLDALADKTAAAILRASARLPDREKQIVLGIAREFGA
jgi:hypothetical protein